MVLGKADGRTQSLSFIVYFYYDGGVKSISCNVGDIFLIYGYGGGNLDRITCNSGGTTYGANNFTVGPGQSGMDDRVVYDIRIIVATSTTIKFNIPGGTSVAVWRLTR